MVETVFQKIIDREAPANIVYEDDQCMAFDSIDPKAPVHVLVIPKKPIAKLSDVTDDDELLLGHLLLKAKSVAAQLGLQESGFRLIINNGAHAGQEVFHLHIHILGGRAMLWPPG